MIKNRNMTLCLNEALVDLIFQNYYEQDKDFFNSTFSIWGIINGSFKTLGAPKCHLFPKTENSNLSIVFRKVQITIGRMSIYLEITVKGLLTITNNVVKLGDLYSQVTGSRIGWVDQKLAQLMNIIIQDQVADSVKNIPLPDWNKLFEEGVNVSLVDSIVGNGQCNIQASLMINGKGVPGKPPAPIVENSTVAGIGITVNAEGIKALIDPILKNNFPIIVEKVLDNSEEFLGFREGFKLTFRAKISVSEVRLPNVELLIEPILWGTIYVMGVGTELPLIGAPMFPTVCTANRIDTMQENSEIVLFIKPNDVYLIIPDSSKWFNIPGLHKAIATLNKFIKSMEKPISSKIAEVFHSIRNPLIVMPKFIPGTDIEANISFHNIRLDNDKLVLLIRFEPLMYGTS